MTIPVACSACHRQFEVDDRFAGRTIKCAYCRQPMSIPVENRAPPPPLAHGEYDLGGPAELEPMSFQASPARRSGGRARDDSPDRVRKKHRKRSDGARRGRKQSEGFFLRPGVLISVAAMGVVVALVVVFVPGARVPVGVTLALPGLLLCLYGYVTGAYIAFTEDDLHGWLYLLVPFYAAYYLVSRWDDMASRLIMVVIGLLLLGIGGRMLESEVARAEAAKSAAAGNS